MAEHNNLENSVPTSSDYWIRRVLIKLRGLYLLGRLSFDGHSYASRPIKWEPDFDVVVKDYKKEGFVINEKIKTPEFYPKKTPENYYAPEHGALHAMSTAGVVKISQYPRHIVKEKVLGISRDITTAYGAQIEQFDYQKFLQQCKLYGIDPTSTSEDLEELTASGATKQSASDSTAYVGIAKLYYDDHMTYISLPGNKEPTKLREDPITPNQGYDHFLKYMFDPNNLGETIYVNTVQGLPKCEKYANLSDLLRYCGFNSTIKNTFFPKHYSNQFKCIAEKEITQRELEAIQKSLLPKPKKAT